MSIIHFYQMTPNPGRFEILTSCGGIRNRRQVSILPTKVTCKRCIESAHYKQTVSKQIANRMKDKI